MESIIYVLLFTLATVLIGMGVMMIVNRSFRNYTAAKWYKSDNVDTQKSFQRSVKIMGGLLYILIGLLIFVCGIWQLDVQHGILRDLPALRSIINSVVQ
jgi:UDP-N-acetylmuramyl pentapeptide phosphotransferase/UDP-N-acetylglucosamine-1-phosphate transferase